MDEAFILQTIGGLYLENARLQVLLREFPSKDAEIAELRREIDRLNLNDSDRSR